MAEGDGGQVEWLEEFAATLRELHDEIITVSGGMLGEHPSFLGACARPFHSAFGEDAYPTPYEKAAALFTPSFVIMPLSMAISAPLLWELSHY